MHDPGFPDYFQKRAAEEREAAERASDERAARTHRELARNYAEKAGSAPAPEPERTAEAGAVLPKGFRILP